MISDTYQDLPFSSPIDPDRKYFSPAEADRALVYIARVIDDVQSTYRRIVRLRRAIEAGGDDAVAEQDYERAMDRLSALVDEVHAAGAELKDFERGLVDFPATHEGREILLCWEAGEPGIAYWHEIDEGVAARRPIAELARLSTAAEALAAR